jgi:hypothetical protein
MLASRDKPPTESFDFTSRGVKLRLFAMLAGVMLVLAVAERALDPDFRKWLATGGQLARSNQEIDTRLPPQPIVASEPDSFAAVALPPPPTGLDEALSRVEDDTLFLRPAERVAWQLLEQRVQETDPTELKRESLGEVGFAQLFHQPEMYRGRVVTVRGTVMNASQIDLDGDDPGRERYVLWIMPARGPNSPIVAYARAMPNGFPTIQRQPGGRLTKIREEVSVTGLMLKRGSYHAQDGPRRAPVIIANVPEWTPQLVAASDTSRTSFGPGWFWPTALAAVGLAAAFVCLAYWLSIRGVRSGRGAADQRLMAADFRGVKVGPSAAETLRQLEQERSESA